MLRLTTTRLEWRPYAIAFALYTAYFLILFAPALLQGYLLTPFDTGDQYYPQFLRLGAAWTNDIFTGFPQLANPENASFSPLLRFWHLLGSFNGYAVSAYILAAFFAFLYALEVSESFYGALVAGTVYASSGLMMFYFTSLTVAEAMVWVPLIFWALERLYRRRELLAVLVGGAGVAMTLLGGHPQILAHTVPVALAYAVMCFFRSSPQTRIAFTQYALGLFLLGLCFSAPQYMRTAEFVPFTERNEINFATYVQFALRWDDVLALFWPFPFVVNIAYDRVLASVLAPTCLIEDANASGSEFAIVGAALALVPLGIRARFNVVTIFWIVIGAFSVLYALGDQTTLAAIMYHFPPYNKFRLNDRHLFFFTLGVAVIAANAVRAIADNTLRTLPLLAAGGVLWLLGLLLAMALLVTQGCLYPHDQMIWWVTAISVVGTGLVVLFGWYASRSQVHRARWIMGIVAVVIVSSLNVAFSTLPSYDRSQSLIPAVREAVPPVGYHTGLPKPTYYYPPISAFELQSLTASDHSRVWPALGNSAEPVGIEANASMLWGITSASGYSPIGPKAVFDVMQMLFTGATYGAWWKEENRAADVAAVRFVTTRRAERSAEQYLQVYFQHPSGKLRLDQPASATGIALIIGAGNAAGLPNGDVIAKLTLRTSQGKQFIRPLVMGRDVADWAYDCPPVHGDMAHSLPRVATYTPVRLLGANCMSYGFMVTIPIDPKTRVVEMDMQKVGKDPAAAWVSSGSFIDAQRRPVGQLSRSRSELRGSKKWRLRWTYGQIDIYENREALGRARLVSRVIGGLTVDQQLTALQTSRLPNGQFDPRNDALVDGGSAQFSTDCARSPVRWLTDEPTRVVLQTAATGACYLVLADTYFPDWRATVDGAPQQVYVTNHAWRGLPLGPGGHIVTFEFNSPYGTLGDSLAVIGLLAALGLAVRIRLRHVQASRSGA